MYLKPKRQTRERPVMVDLEAPLFDKIREALAARLEPSDEESYEKLDLARPSKREKQVLRGCRSTPNVVMPPPIGFYAFLSDIEEHEIDDDAEGNEEGPSGPVTFHFQAIHAQWFNRVLGELVQAGHMQRLLGILQNYGFQQGFETAYPKLTDPDRAFLFELYLWFLSRILQTGDHARVFLIDLVVPPASFEARWLFLRESEWFYLPLTPYGSAFSLPVDVMELGLEPAADSPISRMWIPRLGFTQVLWPIHGLLLMLHFPKTPPASGNLNDSVEHEGGGSGERTHDNQPSAPPILAPFRAPGRPPPRPEIGSWLSQLRDTSLAGIDWIASAPAALFNGVGAAVRRWIDSLDFPGAPPLAPAFVGAFTTPVPALPPARRDEPRRPPALEYTGSNAGAGGGAQAPNPMVRAAYPNSVQPFIGVIDVGQGNCNVLFDNRGHASVYYDFGKRKNGVDPPRGVATVCMCHNPLIIISHWDFDHFLLCRHNPKSYRLQWIAPQQHMGSGDVRETVARILRSGGGFHLWERPDGHMIFPWGFVVRAQDANHDQFEKRYKNNSGLVLYVCVKDDAGVAATTSHNPAPCPVVLGAATAAQMAAALHGTTTAEMAAALAESLAYVRADQAATCARAAGAGHAERAVATAAGALLGAAGIAPLANEDRRILRAADAAAEAERTLAGNARVAAVAAAVATDLAHAAIAASALVSGTAGAFAHLAGNPAAAPAAIQAAAVAAAAALTAPAAAAIAMATAAVVAANPATRAAAANAATGGGATFLSVTVRAVLAYIVDAVGEVDNNAGTDLTVADAIAMAPVGGLSADTLKIILRGAAHMPVGAAPVIPNLQDNDNNAPTHPPTLAGERYVMSTGDAMIHCVPTQRFNPSPTAVGVVAFHHGSNKADGASLDQRCLPWAANTPEARAMAATNVARRPASKAAECVAAHAGAWARAADAAARTADALAAAETASVAAVYAATSLFQPVTFAAARMMHTTAQAHGGWNAGQVFGGAGQADTPANRLAADVAVAARDAMAVAAGAAQHVDAIVSAIVAVAIPPNGRTEPAKTAMNTTANRVKAVVNHATVAAVVLPDESFIKAAVFAASGNAATAAEQTQFAAAVYAAITAHNAAQRPAPTGGALGQLANNGERLGLAIAAAAAAGATRAAGVVIDAASAGAAAALSVLADAGVQGAANRVHNVGGDPSGVIVYSYGNNNTYGHPSPRAIAKYVAHGWTASSETGSTNTDRALGWEDELGYEGPLRGDGGGGGIVDRSAYCVCNGIKRFGC